MKTENQLVGYDVAKADVERWLDFKRVSSRKRESAKDQIESLENEIVDGNITIDDDCNIVYKLKLPIENKDGQITTSELTFRPRLKAMDLEPYLKPVKATDADGRIAAYVCALTKSPKGVIQNLDTEDYSICQNIALFFI